MAAEWKCAGCGKPGLERSCDCVTDVVCRAEPGNHEHGVKTESMYIQAVKGRRDFRTAYRLQLESMRKVAAIVERCKKRAAHQNSFIETDDLSTLEDLTQTIAGSKYRYDETP